MLFLVFIENTAHIALILPAIFLAQPLECTTSRITVILLSKCEKQWGHIRNTDGYNHKLVALTYYSLNYSDLAGTSVISQVNQVVAVRTLAWGGIVADGFGAFAAASTAFGGDTCAAGLRIPLPTSPLTCDIHPSPAGRDLLAQAIVNALRTD